MGRPDLAIIIPALNEAETIGAVVRAAAAFGQVIVIDDGSTDETSRLAEKEGANVIVGARDFGYDRAMESGFRAASRGAFVYAITLDADGQLPVEAIPLFVAELEQGAEVVVGIRPRTQRWSEAAFSLVSRLAFKIKDPLCGMKGYRLSLYRERGHFDSYQSIGTELAIYAARRGKRIGQVPILVRDRASASRFGHSWRAEWKILRALGLGIWKAR